MNTPYLAIKHKPALAAGTRVGIIVAITALIFTVFFLLDVKPTQALLTRAMMDEVNLRTTYQVKHSQTVNQAAHTQQMHTLQAQMQTVLTQLPETADTPHLIAEISKIGAQTDVQFNFIKPLEPVVHDDYIELPLEISINGNYVQFSQFITQLAQLQRIITLDNFTIARVPFTSGMNNMTGSLTPDKTLLVMQLTIRTYAMTLGTEPHG